MSVMQLVSESSIIPYSLGPRYRYRRDDAEPAVQQMFRFSAATALPLMCVDRGSGIVVAKSDDNFVELLPGDVFAKLIDGNLPSVVESSCGLTFYAVPLSDLEGLQTVGIGYVLNQPGSVNDELQQLAHGIGWESEQLESWCRFQRFCSPEILDSVLHAYCDRERLLADEALNQSRQCRLIERLTEQIQVVHRMLAQLAISQNSDSLNESCVANLRHLSSASGCVVTWEQSASKHLEIVQGKIPLSLAKLPELIKQCGGYENFNSIVRQKVAGTLIGADFPGLQNLVLTPILEGSRITGWVCLFNRTDGNDFDQTDIVLTEIMSTLIVTHARNREVYEAHDELLLQFVGSLVTTIDAKDSYTRGHSERVAEITRCLGRQMGLSESDLMDCFNAGLLHDIGKIGVNDAVLQKTDALTPEEYEHVKQHPMIGYRILKGLKSMHRLLPGIRNHHEEFSGTGYPDRLKGAEIPLLARILAVADAYDAMRSDRPYRRGMPLSQVDYIFRRGAGQQWDPDVIEAYFIAHDEVRRIGGPEIWSEEQST